MPEVAKLDVIGNEAVDIADQLLPAETGSSMKQLGYNSEHLVCVQQVESTSEAISVGQVTNLPELSKSKVSVQKFDSPVMSAQSSQNIASSSTATLKDVTPVSASKATHAHALEEASVSEMASNLNAEKSRKQRNSQSVHFSPSRVASVEQIFDSQQVANIPSIIQRQAPVSTEKVRTKVAESSKITSLSATASFGAAPKVIAPKLAHVLPMEEAICLRDDKSFTRT